ncbi:hypothetical protein M0R45_036895 [Rubus argutus]|uniref:Uncharacterized protein n=1 Tax=Rubus argutus TaxID=59490 RepID=A0AAW1VZ60_RUBAR
MSESNEAGTKGEEVLKLKEKLSQCRLERDGLLKREKEMDEEGEESQAGIREKKPLAEALETTQKRVNQLQKDVSKSVAEREMLYMETQTAKVQDKYDRLQAELHRKFEESDADNLKLNMLSSEMDKKWYELYTFLETHVKNLEITDDVRTLVRGHFATYIDTQTDEIDKELLRKFMHSILQPRISQKRNKMSAGVDYKSLISAAVSKFCNFFLRKKMESNGALTNNASSNGKDAKPHKYKGCQEFIATQEFTDFKKPRMIQEYESGKAIPNQQLDNLYLSYHSFPLVRTLSAVEIWWMWRTDLVLLRFGGDRIAEVIWCSRRMKNCRRVRWEYSPLSGSTRADV